MDVETEDRTEAWKTAPCHVCMGTTQTNGRILSPKCSPRLRPNSLRILTGRGCFNNFSRRATSYGAQHHRRNSSDSSGASSPRSPHNFYSSCPSVSSSPPSSYGSVSDTSSPPASHFRSQPRILISSLLSDPYAIFYHLEVVQQPGRAAEFRNTPLSRLPITPPVIVRLVIRDTSGNPVFPTVELPFLIAHLSLYSEDGSTRIDNRSSMSMGPSGPQLYGNLVSSVAQYEDLQGNKGFFFLFPDASIRWRGRYQLGITLLRISDTVSPGVLSTLQHTAALAETRTKTFDVVARDEYIAFPPTRLTTSFLRQGARMFTSIPSTHP